MEEGTTVAPVHQGVLGRIARAVVQVHARYYGRGPTKAKAIWNDTVLCVVLEDLFTAGEKVLTEAGKFERVRDVRQAFQDEIEPVLRREIESLTGRRVRAVVSQVSPENLGAEVFVLEASPATSLGGQSAPVP